VQGKFPDGHRFFIPTVPPLNLKFKLPQNTREIGYCFYPITDKWCSDFEKMGMHVSSDRADADYLFHVSKLKTLSGRELSSRRNLLNQLESSHLLESEPMTAENMHLALDILEKWQEQTKKAKENMDYFSCKEALENFRRLDLFGRITIADGVPIAFTIGELLTPTTALMHFAKSLKHYKGATVYLYKDFASHLPANIEWINLEQDLGIPALRQAKEAYHPDMLLTKWRAC
jgi:uncharacterized protein